MSDLLPATGAGVVMAFCTGGLLGLLVGSVIKWLW